MRAKYLDFRDVPTVVGTNDHSRKSVTTKTHQSALKDTSVCLHLVYIQTYWI